MSQKRDNIIKMLINRQITGKNVVYEQFDKNNK